jgi:hypothetical protein
MLRTHSKLTHLVQNSETGSDLVVKPIRIAVQSTFFPIQRKAATISQRYSSITFTGIRDCPKARIKVISGG